MHPAFFLPLLFDRILNISPSKHVRRSVILHRLKAK